MSYCFGIELAPFAPERCLAEEKQYMVGRAETGVTRDPRPASHAPSRFCMLACEMQNSTVWLLYSV